MIIGVPTEIKAQEFRVGLPPSSAHELIANGHEVLIQSDAGDQIGFDNTQYVNAGATITHNAEEIFSKSELIVKVKEPLVNECLQLKPGQTLFTFLHLAPAPEQAELLLNSGATCIAYETVTDHNGGLPLLTPMSEIAGRLSVQTGAHHLEKTQGGMGCLLGGVPGVPPAKVLVLGGGVVGTQAASIALGMGANVTVIDKSLTRLRQLDREFSGQLNTVYSTVNAINEHAIESDLVIGAVLIPGDTAPRLLRREAVKQMKKGSVIVDVAIDQGGCFETSRPTTHASPTYIIDGVIHCCITNMPSACARTATLALSNATLPYVITLANKGTAEAISKDKGLRNGVNVHSGHITHPSVAKALNLPYHELA